MNRTLTAPGDRFFYSVHTLMRLWDPLDHPFYRRWSADALAATELAAFAAQHEHTVEVIAELSARTVTQAPPDVRAELEQHARVEAHHLELWRAVRAELPRPLNSSPTAETTRCAATWSGTSEQPFERHLAVLHAIGASRARISTSELTSLASAGAIPKYATEYLSLHAGLDAQRARCAHRILQPLLSSANTPQLVNEAGAALQAHWDLLTGIHQLLTPPPQPPAHN